MRISIYLPNQEPQDLNDEPPVISHFNNDPELPVYSQRSAGYSLSELVEILMRENVQTMKCAMFNHLV